MITQDGIIFQLRNEISKYLGFKKKTTPEHKNSLDFDSFQGKNFFLYRYSLGFPRNNERNFIQFSSMNNDSNIQKNIKNNSFSLINSFNMIKEKYSNSGLIRSVNDHTEIHICLIKQYWFDCCVSFSIFLKILLAPISQKEWILLEDFCRSIEAVQQKNVCRAFFSQKEDKKFNSMMRLQKFLCKNYSVFFCVVEFEYNEIDESGLIKVFELANRTQKTSEKDLVNIARHFLIRANNRRKEVRPVIRFEEFMALVLNS